VLTGIFVERACEFSGLDKDLSVQVEMKRNETFLVEMKKIFDEADIDGSGTITWHEFKAYLANPQVQAYLCTKQLNAFDARMFFDMLVEDRTDDLDLEAFIVGCQRLKGEARSVDLLAVLKECRENRRDIKALLRRLECAVPTEVGSLKSPSSIPNSHSLRRSQTMTSVTSLK